MAWRRVSVRPAGGLLLSALMLFGTQTSTAKHQPQRVGVPLSDLTLHADFYAAPGDGKAPAVLLLHGWHWPHDKPLTTMAPYARAFQANGYHVLVPAMRGWPPTGGSDDCAGRQVDDAMAALAWLARQPSVARSRLFLSGYSQGGQVALLATARAAPVQATAVFAPVTHPARWVEQTDTDGIREYLYRECSGPRGWPSRDPVAVAQQIQVPVLLVHGMRDERVPTDQSMLLHEQLQRLGRTTQLRLLAGSDHAVERILQPGLALKFFAEHAASTADR